MTGESSVVPVSPPLGLWQQAWRLLAAAAVGVGVWLIAFAQLTPGTTGPRLDWLLVGDPLVGIGCLLAALYRRRSPFTVAMAVAIVSTASLLGTGAAVLTLGSLATRRRPWEIGPVALACIATWLVSTHLYPHRRGLEPLWLRASSPTLVVGMVVATGVAVGARREELRSLRLRAEIAEREQSLLAAQTRVMERHRIAREMHDVVAHRISLIAMQAGVLGHRKDLPTDEVTGLARAIAGYAHQALEELRDVLGVLRASPREPEAPQPSLAGVPALIADAQVLGLRVAFTASTDGEPPALIARTAYRIVQEGLTNAGKHAPGAHVSVTIAGAAGDGLCVTVRDTGAPRIAESPPVSGFGLLGLAERVSLAGGKLTYGRISDGGFSVEATLPWPNRTTDGST